MFLDFALLTEQQGELLDQIEFQVKNAADHVEDANVDVHQAIEYQKAVRKKQWCVTKNLSIDLVYLAEWISLHCCDRLCVAAGSFLLLSSLLSSYFSRLEFCHSWDPSMFYKRQYRGCFNG